MLRFFSKSAREIYINSSLRRMILQSSPFAVLMQALDLSFSRCGLNDHLDFDMNLAEIYMKTDSPLPESLQMPLFNGALNIEFSDFAATVVQHTASRYYFGSKFRKCKILRVVAFQAAIR